MLDQENQSNTATVEQQQQQQQQSTLINNISNNNNKNDNTSNGDNSNDINSSNKLLPDSNGTSDAVGGNRLLNEHDYCSPNKNSSNSTSTDIKESANHTDGTFKQQGDEPNSQSTLSATECQASSSSSPCREGKNGDKLNTSVQLQKTLTTNEDGNLSDDSTSSSSITSDDSTMDLIIASEGFERRAKPIAPKDTPSVSKPKLGRRPNLKTDFIVGKSKSQKQPQQPTQPRPKRPRQNISVTDKSQWITGDEQIDSALAEQQPAEVRDKRQRKEVHDPLYSHFTSSDYSSSDADSEQVSDAEDDPNRNWCICDKPDDGNFMISCDICEYWFHSACIGVTEKMSQRWTKEGKEWFCPECDHALENGTPRNAIPSKIIKTEKKKSSSSKKTGKRRGRPKKSSSPTREVSTRLSLRNAKKANDSIDSRSGSTSSARKSSARSESFEKFGDSIRLKELIKERKKAFFHRHRLSEQLRAEKMKELGLGRKSMTASLGSSMNSLVSNTNSPNMNNLPINIKSEHKERSKPNIVLQINTKKDGSLESSGQRIVTTIVKKRKHSDSYETTMSAKIKDELQNGDAAQKTPPASDALAFLDSTKDHKNHIFDINCKICTRQKKEGSVAEEEVESDEKVEKADGSEIEPKIKIEQQDKAPEPKRLRISIDSKLDPSKILRLKEPLIKPVEQPKDVIEYSPSRISPAGQSDSDSAEGDDADDIYDPETSTLGPRKSIDSISPPVERNSDEPCWTGTITMPDVCKFSASARAVSGSANFMQTDFNENLLICGRIVPDQVFSFVKKLKSTTKNEFILVQLQPLNENDKSSFDLLFDYLYKRNRCGVINNSANSRILKDFYVLPIHEGKSIPDILKPLNGPGLDKKEPNCLMCLFIRTAKRPPSAASSASNYTPTPMS